jgi:hypothetical protein
MASTTTAEFRPRAARGRAAGTGRWETRDRSDPRVASTRTTAEGWPRARGPAHDENQGPRLA